MAEDYQETDYRIVDYEPFCLDPEIIDPSRNRPLVLRGPRPASLEKGEYFVCLGAAQTFGRFVARPFPNLLQDRLKLPVLNISYGGAGPSFFRHDDERLLEYLNNARFVVVQVMSGRSEGNSLFACSGVGHYIRRSDGSSIGCDEAYEELLRTCSRSRVDQIVQETRNNWLDSYRALLSKVTSPKILFWFSTRKPDYRQSYDDASGLFGSFPQLINGPALKALRAECDAFASCVSKRGLPHRLVDRETGEAATVQDPWATTPWDSNWYYPSPQMHEDAANALEPKCRDAAGLASGRKRWRARLG